MLGITGANRSIFRKCYCISLPWNSNGEPHAQDTSCNNCPFAHFLRGYWIKYHSNYSNFDIQICISILTSNFFLSQMLPSSLILTLQ